MSNASIIPSILTLLVLFNNIVKGEYQIDQKDTTCYVLLDRFYDGRGIVFSKNDNFIKSKKDEQQINLTISEVIEAEVILDSLTNLQFKDDSLKINKIKTKRRKYNRHYWGIQTDNGEKIIQMYIFNFSNPKAIKYFENWDKGFVFGTDDFYAENARIYWINLTKRKLENGSWPLELK